MQRQCDHAGTHCIGGKSLVSPKAAHASHAATKERLEDVKRIAAGKGRKAMCKQLSRGLGFVTWTCHRLCLATPPGGTAPEVAHAAHAPSAGACKAALQALLAKPIVNAALLIIRQHLHDQVR